MLAPALIPLLLLAFQKGDEEADVAANAIVLKADRLFDGKADVLTPRGMVIVQGRRIRSVGVDLPIPDGALVLDLRDTTLCPGFIDAHTHLTHQRDPDYNRGVVEGLRREVPEEAILATVYARRTVEAGFTTVRDVGNAAKLRRHRPAPRHRGGAGPRADDP